MMIARFVEVCPVSSRRKRKRERVEPKKVDCRLRLGYDANQSKAMQKRGTVCVLRADNASQQEDGDFVDKTGCQVKEDALWKFCEKGLSWRSCSI